MVVVVVGVVVGVGAAVSGIDECVGGCCGIVVAAGGTVGWKLALPKNACRIGRGGLGWTRCVRCDIVRGRRRWGSSRRPRVRFLHRPFRWLGGHG